MKVLLFSNDIMPFGGLPTSGGGLRCWQIKKGLELAGIEVLSSMPGFTYLAEKYRSAIPERERELLWSFGQQDEILRRVRPDAVIFASNWDHYNLSSRPDIPLIIDLHGSRVIETKMWGNPVSPERKVEILSLADCLLAAGQRQRLYFYGWLMQAGRVPQDEHFIRFMPVSLGPEKFVRAEQDGITKPWFVSGGGWFPWQNQSTAIFGICNQIIHRQTGRVDIFGTPHEKLGFTPEEEQIREIYQQVQKLAADNQRINVCGYLGRQELLKVYAQAQIAVEAMDYNLERELAFTTRTVEYLWCGLPVIYNNFSEIADYISEYDAGWTIDPKNEQALELVLNEIYDAPEKVQEKSLNAQRLVFERLNWERTISPLVNFLNNPTRASLAKPALGSVYARPSYLRPRGRVVEKKLSGSVKQDFIVPGENIAGIEFSVRLSQPINSFSLVVKNAKARTIVAKNYNLSDIPKNGLIRLRFPSIFRPKGGDVLTLELALDAGQGEMFLQVLPNVVYPYPTAASGSLENVSLALYFTPADWILSYQLRVFAARGLALIKRGEWRRVYRGIRYRVPMLVRRVWQKAHAT